eukprot:3472041-Prorocentrum_lima.AAC.1
MHTSELPGAWVVPGQPPHCEPGEDPSLGAWPPGLGDGPGGPLRWVSQVVDLLVLIPGLVG